MPTPTALPNEIYRSGSRLISDKDAAYLSRCPRAPADIARSCRDSPGAGERSRMRTQTANVSVTVLGRVAALRSESVLFQKTIEILP